MKIKAEDEIRNKIARVLIKPYDREQIKFLNIFY